MTIAILIGFVVAICAPAFWFIWTDDYAPMPRFTVYVVTLPAAKPKPSKPSNVTNEAWDAHRLYGAPLPKEQA